MLPTPAAVAMAGQLLALAFACGLNLYATVALLGLASRLGWFADLPTSLRGLENGLVIFSAALLFLIEFVIDKVPYADAFWDAVHTIVRPLGAALLVAIALGEAPVDVRAAAAAITGLATLAAHASKAGVRVIMNARPRLARTITVSLLEDILAIALVVAALTNPAAATAAVAALLLPMLVVAPVLWRAAALGIRASIAWLRGFFGTAGWLDAARLPSALRPLVSDPVVGLPPPRATRAALVGHRAAGAYRNGWLVLENGQAAFVYRARFRSHRFDLPPADPASVRRAMLTDIVELAAEPHRLTLFLLKDGPPVESALADLGPRTA